MSRCRNRPNWRYLYSTPRGNTMLLILVLCVVGIKWTYNLYGDVFPTKEIKFTSSVNGSLLEAKAEIDDVTAKYVTEVLPGENKDAEDPSNNIEGLIENYEDEYSESTGVAGKGGEDVLTTTENDSVIGQSSAFRTVIPIKNDLRIVHQKRLLWCIHCFFFAYNLIVVVVHIFVKMFLVSNDDIYKMTTTMTLMYNWMLTFLAVLSIKDTGYLILPFMLELTITFLVTFIKCKIYPDISEVAEESIENQVAEAHGDVAPPEQMLLEEYVNNQNDAGGQVDAEDADLSNAEDADLSNAEEGNANTVREENEETIFLEDRVDVGDVGLQYHDERREDRLLNPDSANLSLEK